MTARPLRVALTGGIATGKSHCLSRFRTLGAATVDADALARDAVEPGSPGLAAVVARFGPGMLRADGELDRPSLARIVFADAAARHDLEAIVHPFVYQALTGWFERLPDSTPAASVGMADVPLLFETGHEGDFDRIIVTSCRPEQQIERAMARDHLPRADAVRRIALQWPTEKKRAGAHFVIDTSGDFARTDAQVDEVWRALTTPS
jgi:dephospho-CoA kinase